MALIYFYDSTELDEKQLRASFEGTDHHLEFVEDKINPSNCNSDAEVISVFVTSQVTREVIEAMPKLKVIACRSTGFNNIDFTAVAEHVITVLNVPTYGDATVAEYAFTLLLALTRKFPEVLEAENEKFVSSELTGTDLQGKVFGSIGTGHIGQKALKIADGFSMKTIAYDPYKNLELEDKYHFKYVELDELLAQADVVSIHVPYLPSTHHIMNSERLGKMKDGALLINTARGELVDTKALFEALDSGHLGGAGIDVLEGEALLNFQDEAALLRSDKIPEDMMCHSVEIDALEKMPNVIVSPHNAFNTVEAIQRINDTAAKNIIDFWYGNTPNKVLPPEKPVGKLLVVRHAESEWNAKGQWTGITDIYLSDNGFKQAVELGQALTKMNILINTAYCSEQIRTRETLEDMLSASQQFNVEIVTTGALNERDYGEYTGKNKWEVQKQIGEEAFDNIRRGWDVPVPGGETLKMVYERVVPYYKNTILPKLQSGDNVLIVAHGNSIRALMKYLESINDDDVSDLEMLFGEIITYEVSPDGLSVNSTVNEIDITPPHA
jgi:D-lactate dehydrogenase